MEELIQIEGQSYVLATSPSTDPRTRVLKHQETFAVFNMQGDIHPIGNSAQGFFHGATRFLSLLEIRIGRSRPFLLSSAVVKTNTLLRVDMTNPDINQDGKLLTRGTLHIFRSKFLRRKTCIERVRISNFSKDPVEIPIGFRFRNDFADIFEIRGMARQGKGQQLDAVISSSDVSFTYEGLDKVTRKTRVRFYPRPDKLEEHSAQYFLKLGPHKQMTINLRIEASTSEVSHGESDRFEDIRHSLISRESPTRIVTSNERFNMWLNRSLSDLDMMITRTKYGLYPYAGIPWYNTVFGRDGIITAFQALWTKPVVAKGVLNYLAATQAPEHSDEHDAEPGKILHELRTGEMVAVGDVPFQRYYGTVDATPLFVALASEYYDRTGDLDFIRSIWPQIERALNWIDKFGDVDGDGFVEYKSHSPKGLTNQGWKDSFDSIFHEDGALALGPIALAEVQGYVYMAKQGASELAFILGHKSRANDLSAQAAALKVNFAKSFWSEKLSSFVLALDGQKRPCEVLSSNAGQALFGGIATLPHAQKVAHQMLSEPMFSGWGIRTIGEAAPLYNPMSYHNGSIWPHDNAMIAEGLSQYGLKTDVLKILEGLFEASLHIDENRLPELFCGFPRRYHEGPTLYPVACSPQAWASGSVLMILKAALGLRIYAPQGLVQFRHPHLPDFLTEVNIENLRVNNASVDLAIRRYGEDVGINILKKSGPVEVHIVK